MNISHSEGFSTWLHSCVNSETAARSRYTMSCFHRFAYHRRKRKATSLILFLCSSGSTSGTNISCMLRSTSASSTGKSGKTEASKPRYRTQIAFSTARYGLIPTLSSCANSQGQSTGCLLTLNAQSKTIRRLISTEAKCSPLWRSRYSELKRAEGKETFTIPDGSTSSSSPCKIASISAVERCACTLRKL